MTSTLRVAFAGTPEFAQIALAAIHQAGFPVVAVLSQPDRPAGRGMQLQASPVTQYAVTHGFAPILQPPSLRRTGKYPQEAAEAIDALTAQRPDVMVVAAYGLILPQEVLDLPRFGCINIHASLLPRWRGAAPIHRAMDAGLDTCDMIAMERVPIGLTDTTGTLHDTLAALGGRMVVEALAKLAQDGKLHATPQPAEGITYAEKIAKDEAALDWSRHAAALLRQVHAFNPFPGASAALDGVAIKFWQAEVLADRPAEAEPGVVLAANAEGVTIACGAGALRVTQLQKPGGKRLPAREFLQGLAIQPGQRFASRG
jgi:methionyl-tRNA formyltransferase